MLSIVSQSKLLAEQEINEELFRHIDKRESFVFDAGAGSGKTYSLVECLKYILKTDGERLRARSQKVACITFTNVAAKEIHKRLGENSVVEISTIHNFLWPKLQLFQNDLIVVHKKKLRTEIESMREDLVKNEKCNTFASLSKNDQDLFEQSILSARDTFYATQDMRAPDFRVAIKSKLSGLPFIDEMLKNVANFRRIARNIIRIDDYRRCLSSIERHDTGYTCISYDPSRTRDSLANMKFSHDTLLEYGLETALLSASFRRVLVDSFPFVLIDEYQDTSETVVSLMETLAKEAATLGRSFVVGYFGDAAQNIYEAGIGAGILERSANYAVVTKPHNRRSCREIIEVGNRIRRDEIQQVSIYEDDQGGIVEFFAPKGLRRFDDDAIRLFVEETATCFNAEPTSPLHCLVLTNELAARLAGFGELYACMKETAYFKKYYEKLREEFVASNPEKLNAATRLLFDLCNMRNAVLSNHIMLSELFSNDALAGSGITLAVVREAVCSIRSIDACSLSDFISGFDNQANVSNGNEITDCMRIIAEYRTGLSSLSQHSVLTHLADTLFPHASPEDMESNFESLSRMLKIGFEEYDAWRDFISGTGTRAIRYHTYHGTKGAEYEKVLIIGSHKFGRVKGDIFKLFFQHYNDNPTDEIVQQKCLEARNMLYVATTRAITRLRVLYNDDISSFSENVRCVFGNIEYVDPRDYAVKD